MPTAEPFIALGKGNGFPYCPQRVDVSSYANWCTLSGHTGGPVTEESINASLSAAMQLHWNSHQLLCSADFTEDSSPDGDFKTSNVSDTKTIPEEPRERVCFSQIGTGRVGFFTPGFGRQGVTSRAEFSFKIVRMYNGSFLDEDNFVGYGVAPSTTADQDIPEITYRGIKAEGTNNILTQFARVELVSFTDSTSFNSDTRTQQVGITTIPTGINTVIYFLCIAAANSPGPNGTFGIPPEIDTVNYTRNVSAANRFASLGGKTTAVLFDGYDEDFEEKYVTVTNTSNSSASISDIDFYRY